MLGWMEVLRGLTGSNFRWMDSVGGLTGALFDWSYWVGGLTGGLFDWSYSGAVRPLVLCGEPNWGGVRPGQCSIRRTEWGSDRTRRLSTGANRHKTRAEHAHKRLARGEDTDDGNLSTRIAASRHLRSFELLR